MNEVEIQVKLFIGNEYENTLNKNIELPNSISKDEMTQVVEDKLNDIMNKDYEVHNQWEDCNVSWIMDSWKVI